MLKWLGSALWGDLKSKLTVGGVILAAVLVKMWADSRPAGAATDAIVWTAVAALGLAIILPPYLRHRRGE